GGTAARHRPPAPLPEDREVRALAAGLARTTCAASLSGGPAAAPVDPRPPDGGERDRLGDAVGFGAVSGGLDLQPEGGELGIERPGVDPRAVGEQRKSAIRQVI